MDGTRRLVFFSHTQAPMVKFTIKKVAGTDLSEAMQQDAATAIKNITQSEDPRIIELCGFGSGMDTDEVEQSTLQAWEALKINTDTPVVLFSHGDWASKESFMHGTMTLRKTIKNNGGKAFIFSMRGPNEKNHKEMQDSFKVYQDEDNKDEAEGCILEIEEAARDYSQEKVTEIMKTMKNPPSGDNISRDAKQGFACRSLVPAHYRLILGGGNTLMYDTMITSEKDATMQNTILVDISRKNKHGEIESVDPLVKKIIQDMGGKVIAPTKAAEGGASGEAKTADDEAKTADVEAKTMSLPLRRLCHLRVDAYSLLPSMHPLHGNPGPFHRLASEYVLHVLGLACEFENDENHVVIYIIVDDRLHRFQFPLEAWASFGEGDESFYCHEVKQTNRITVFTYVTNEVNRFRPLLEKEEAELLDGFLASWRAKFPHFGF
jgi:hypothetical protein